MRSITVNIRLVLSSLLAILALGAVTASAAQAATEGPFFKTMGLLSPTRLASGSSVEVKGSLTEGASEKVKFLFDGSEVGVECKKGKFESGAKLLGSTGANAGGGEATIEFSGCESAKSGCPLESSTIKTVALKMQLGYLKSTRTGPIAAIFEAASGKGAKMFEIKFKKEGDCSVSGASFQVDGHLISEDGTYKKLVEVGKEPAIAKTADISMIDATGAFVESSGSLTEKSGLTIDGEAVDDEGTFELELAGGKEWGIFT